jgi:hypothetical protein
VGQERQTWDVCVCVCVCACVVVGGGGGLSMSMSVFMGVTKFEGVGVKVER